VESSHRPDGNALLACISILAVVWIKSCSTRDGCVPALPANLHRPDGKIADALASTLACTTAADALVNYSLLYVPQASCDFPIAPMGKLLTCLHRLTLGQFRTLRSTTECRCHRDLEKIPSPPWETHVLLVVCRAAVSLSMEAQWPSLRARSVETQLLDRCVLMFKTSHRPHGKLTIACCMQGGGIYVSSGTVTITSSSISGNTANYVRAHAQKFPRWETHVLLVVCRVAVSMLGATMIGQAQWQSHRAPSVGTQQEGCALVLKISHLGDSRFACRLQGGGVLVYDSYDSTVSIVNSQVYSNWAYFVRAHAQKFPSPRWEGC
jgi:hypothetical protein